MRNAEQLSIDQAIPACGTPVLARLLMLATGHRLSWDVNAWQHLNTESAIQYARRAITDGIRFGPAKRKRERVYLVMVG